MRHSILAALLIGSLASPLAAAAAPQAAKTARATKPAKPAASHSLRGVIKSIDATSMTVTRSGKKGSDLNFVLNPSTSKEGQLMVGSVVSVRYRAEGTSNVATAVVAQPAAKKSASLATGKAAK